MLVLVRSFVYTPDTSFSEEIFLLVLVRSFCYTPQDGFSEEFLLHSWY